MKKFIFFITLLFTSIVFAQNFVNDGDPKSVYIVNDVDTKPFDSSSKTLFSILFLKSPSGHASIGRSGVYIMNSKTIMDYAHTVDFKNWWIPLGCKLTIQGTLDDSTLRVNYNIETGETSTEGECHTGYHKVPYIKWWLIFDENTRRYTMQWQRIHN